MKTAVRLVLSILALAAIGAAAIASVYLSAVGVGYLAIHYPILIKYLFGFLACFGVGFILAGVILI